MTHFNKNKTGARERRVEEREQQEQELQLQLCNCRRSREVCDVAVAQWEKEDCSGINLVIAKYKIGI